DEPVRTEVPRRTAPGVVPAEAERRALRRNRPVLTQRAIRRADLRPERDRPGRIIERVMPVVGTGLREVRTVFPRRPDAVRIRDPQVFALPPRQDRRPVEGEHLARFAVAEPGRFAANPLGVPCRGGPADRLRGHTEDTGGEIVRKLTGTSG